MCSLLHLDHGCLTRTSHGSVDTAVSAEEPMWPKCRREAQVEFLRKEVWGHLKWFLKSPEVQVIEAFDLHVQDGCLVVTFPLESFEVDFGLGGAAFLVSAIDNVIVTGPHGQEQLEIVDGEARKED
ncbi:unnamed protein product [Durusdinium trenchii]|uniref:Gem-associated protein 7 n=2 Tax=Durusdinium trenchii TaxID=1381693 RepID=A0ABP0QDB4_9DINO